MPRFTHFVQGGGQSLVNRSLTGVLLDRGERVQLFHFRVVDPTLVTRILQRGRTLFTDAQSST